MNRDWMKDAACRGVDPEMFFPDKSDSPLPAIRICHRCPVSDACLKYALETKVVGVWGGMVMHGNSSTGGHGGRRRGSGRNPKYDGTILCAGPCGRPLRNGNSPVVPAKSMPGSVKVYARGRCMSCDIAMRRVPNPQTEQKRRHRSPRPSRAREKAVTS